MTKGKRHCNVCLEKHSPPTGKQCRRADTNVKHVNSSGGSPSVASDKVNLSTNSISNDTFQGLINDNSLVPPLRDNTALPGSGLLPPSNGLDMSSGLRTNFVPSFSLAGMPQRGLSSLQSGGFPQPGGVAQAQPGSLQHSLAASSSVPSGLLQPWILQPVGRAQAQQASGPGPQGSPDIGALVAQLQGLTQALQATGRVAQDNPAAVGFLPAQALVPGIGKKTLESSLLGECIELNDFLPPITASAQLSDNDLEPYLDSNNAVCYKKKKHSHKIMNFSMWSEAWVRYQKHMVANLGVELHAAMADYFLFILESDRKYSWSAIAMYDYRHRLALAGRLSLGERLAFSIADPTLLPTILDATAIKPNAIKCSRCFGFDHRVGVCPFPEAPKGTSQGKTQGAKNKTQEICQNFNRDKCQYGDLCFRRHQCRVCKGTLPFSKCNISGPCNGKGKDAT